jgi:hypothetical protein
VTSVTVNTVSVKVVMCAAMLLVALGAGGPEARAQDPQPAPAAAGPAVEKRFFTSRDRLQALRAATLFTPRAVAEADILAGPPQKKDQFQLHLNDTVTCEFTKAGEEKNGNTPKFDCRITRVEDAQGHVQTPTPGMDEEPVKVKFGRDNRETYAEAASTRLLWALGFYADGMFPVRVTCLNCPADPQRASGTKGTHVFNEGVIERKAKGRKMYEVPNEDQGWSWKELDTVARPSYEKDGLKMIAAFIIHSDNKPAQQRLVCDGVEVNQATTPFTTTCQASRILVQDVGATFGGGGAFTNKTSAKMNLSEWSHKAVWKKVGTSSAPADCQAELPASLAAKDGLSNPAISEEGRRFAAGLLCQLSDRQVTDLFTVARVAEQPDFHNADGSFKHGLNEAAVVTQWVDAFKRKREALAAGRCRMKTPPADLAVIDNPAGLPTVPNFCTARPF